MESRRPRDFSTLIQELKSRKVFRVAVTYVAIAFAGLQGVDLILSPLGVQRAYRWIVIATLAGFPLALVLAWFFDVRRSAPQGSTSQAVITPSLPRARTRITRSRVAIVALLVLAGAGLYGYRRMMPGGNVPGAAEIIAVAPFAAVGPDALTLGEGMARLLSTNLDQVGGLRTLDPTRVLRVWQSGSRHSDEEALELAAKLGAGSVLIGNVVEAGRDVRLTAVLKAVNGKDIARAQVTGAAANVLLLADSLSNRLLREIWRSRSPVPRLRIASITTSNLDAIRAYLEGERFYRQLQFDSAIVALDRAVAADSTFALARRRLVDAYVWVEQTSPMVATHERAAAANITRLPERERALAEAYVLWHQDKNYQSALDSLDAHLRRYPDDADALNLRAEILLHGNGLGAWLKPPDTLLAAFEAALHVDPELTPAMIHPLILSAQVNDTTRFRHYATALLHAQRSATADVEPVVDSIVDLLWRGKVDPDLLRRLNRGTEPGISSMLMPLSVAMSAGIDPHAIADAMLADLDSASTRDLLVLADALMATGRIRDADKVVRRLHDPVMEWRFRATAVAFGMAPRTFAPGLRPPPNAPANLNPLWWEVSRTMLYLTEGDTTSAVKALSAARAAKLPPALDALRRFNEGRLRFVRGDMAAGLKQMETAFGESLAAQPNPVAPPPFFSQGFLAFAHAAYPPTRTRGIDELRRLQLQFRGSTLSTVIQLNLARALDAAGMPDAAIEQYAGFVNLTSRAEGPLARMHAEAKAALARLLQSKG